MSIIFHLFELVFGDHAASVVCFASQITVAVWVHLVLLSHMHDNHVYLYVEVHQFSSPSALHHHLHLAFGAHQRPQQLDFFEPMAVCFFNTPSKSRLSVLLSDLWVVSWDWGCLQTMRQWLKPNT
jgi:hypothetical protein